MAKRKYSIEDLTSPAGASQFKSHAIRKSVEYDAFGTTNTFIVRVLSQPLPMSANDFRAVMSAMGELGGTASALGADNASRLVFMGRIVSQKNSTPSPHETLPDPCRLSTAAGPAAVGCAAKIISWHTKFFSKKEYGGIPPNVGDLVKVTVLPGDFKYNLQFAHFDSLESAAGAAPDQPSCSNLKAKFGTFLATSLGDVLEFDEVESATFSATQMGSPTAVAGGAGDFSNPYGNPGFPNLRCGPSLAPYNVKTKAQGKGWYKVDFAKIKQASVIESGSPCATPANASAKNLKDYMGDKYRLFEKAVGKTEGDVTSNNDWHYLGMHQQGVSALEGGYLRKGVTAYMRQRCGIKNQISANTEAQRKCIANVLDNKKEYIAPPTGESAKDCKVFPGSKYYAAKHPDAAGCWSQDAAGDWTNHGLPPGASGNWTGKNGATSRATFLNNEPAQLDQFDILANRNFRQIRDNKWADLNNVADVAGILGAMHLGGGMVKHMVNNGKEPNDPNGTLLSTYYSQKGAAMCPGKCP